MSVHIVRYIPYDSQLLNGGIHTGTRVSPHYLAMFSALDAINRKEKHTNLAAQLWILEKVNRHERRDDM